MSKEEREYFNNLVNTMHSFFINLVAKERHLSVASVTKIADGSIMMGSAAKKVGLVDEIGDSDDIIEMFSKEYAFDKNIKIIDVLPPEPDEVFSKKVLKFIGFTVDSVFNKISNKISTENNIKY